MTVVKADCEFALNVENNCIIFFVPAGVSGLPFSGF